MSGCVKCPQCFPCRCKYCVSLSRPCCPISRRNWCIRNKCFGLFEGLAEARLFGCFANILSVLATIAFLLAVAEYIIRASGLLKETTYTNTMWSSTAGGMGKVQNTKTEQIEIVAPDPGTGEKEPAAVITKDTSTVTQQVELNSQPAASVVPPVQVLEPTQSTQPLQPPPPVPIPEYETRP